MQQRQLTSTHLQSVTETPDKYTATQCNRDTLTSTQLQSVTETPDKYTATGCNRET